MIRLSGLAKSFGGRQLFDGIDWQLPTRGCWGLVGPNGAGKTTLLRLIVGQDEPDSGQVIIGRRTDIGYLPQEATVESRETLLEFIKQGAAPLLKLKAELEATIEQLELAPDEQKPALSIEMTQLEETFRRRGGYTIESLARQIAIGMGFKHEDFVKPLDAFSGGWRMKALLSQLLLQSPDVLFLDEPTNHLDMESVEWLEQFLRQYQGAVVLISHDRYFLNRIVEGIAELSPQQLYLQPGDYDHYQKWKQAEQERLVKLAAEQGREIERIEQFVDRFRYKATKSAQVQSRIKQLDKIERIEIDALRGPAMNFRFVQPERMGKIVAQAVDLAKRFGDRTVYERANFQLNRGDKVALVGPNGAGKSTLLKMLAGALTPDQGHIELGFQVSLSYFAQHSVDQLDLESTLLDEMTRWATPQTAGQVRNVLGAFGFSGDAVERKIQVLSGGEKTRLALGKLLLRPAGLLLLDEPTNHLDMESREILEDALREFEGAVCVVSHDRYFLNQFVNRVVHIEDGVLTEYAGDYEYYKWRRAKDLEALEQANPAGEGASDSSPDPDSLVNKKEQRRLAAQLRQERQVETRDLRKSLAQVESTIEKAETRITELEVLLADPSIYQSDDQGAQLNREYQELNATLETTMTKWEELQLELEAIDAKYQDYL